MQSRWAPLSIKQVRTFFIKLRGKAEQPPYRMVGFQEVFIRDLVSVSPDREPGEEVQLRETLALQWKQFEEEYAQVPEEGLDKRFTRFVLIESSGDDAIH